MKNHFYTFMFLIAAVVLYAVGMVLPATGLFILGMFAELTFWVRMFGGNRRNGDA